MMAFWNYKRTVLNSEIIKIDSTVDNTKNSLRNNPPFLPPSEHYPVNEQSGEARFEFDKSPKEMTAPPFLKSKKDPDTQQQVWRLGGSASEMGNVVKHPNGNHRITITHAQHYYSRATPTNKDETYVLGSAGRGTAYAALWRLSDKQLVSWMPTGTNTQNPAQRQLLWDKNNNNVYWYVDGNKLMRATINFQNYATKAVLWYQFSRYKDISFGLGEGDFSDDGQRIVVVGSSRKEKNTFTILSFLVDSKKVIASMLILPTDEYILDNATIDPTGDYIVFNWPIKGRSMWVMPFSQKKAPRMLYKHTKHSDFVIDEKREPWIVFGNWQGVFATQLSKSFLKRVWPTLTFNKNPQKFDGSKVASSIIKTASGHISRVSSLPGYVLISRNSDGGFYFLNIDNPGTTFYVGNSHHGKRSVSDVFSKKELGVDKNGELVNTNGRQDYLREPRASASQSGRYIFFVSDYHVYGNHYGTKPQIKAYLNVIDLAPSMNLNSSVNRFKP